MEVEVRSKMICWLFIPVASASLDLPCFFKGTGGVIYQHEADAQAAVSELDRKLH